MQATVRNCKLRPSPAVAQITRNEARQILEVSLVQNAAEYPSTVLSSISCNITENKAKYSRNYRGK